MISLTNVTRNRDAFLRFRISVYFLAFSHLMIMAAKLFSKDFEQSNDEKLRIYAKIKWKLITAWFNLLTMPYLSLCLYCDWHELKHGNSPYLKALKQMKDFSFSTLVLPTTFFADVLFWKLWHRNRELIVPLSADAFLAVWEHHSMHTVSLLFVIFDLIFVRRKRPKNMTPGVIVMTIFVTAYILMCLQSYLNEEYIYPLFQTLPPYKLFVLTIYTYTSFLFYYSSQWLIVDLIHGQTLKNYTAYEILNAASQRFKNKLYGLRM